MSFNGSFKVDFKEAREKTGFTLPQMQGVFNDLGYKIDLESVENKGAKLQPGEVDALMGVYSLPHEQQKGYYEKYTNM